MRSDVAGHHPACIHRQDLVIEARKAALVLRQNLRFEFAKPVSSCDDFHVAEIPLLPLLAGGEGSTLAPRRLVGRCDMDSLREAFLPRPTGASPHLRAGLME